MSARFIELMLRLSPRERWLIAVLICAVMPLALYFGVAAPLMDKREAAVAQLNEARALNGWVGARSLETRQLQAQLSGAPDRATGPIGASAVEQGLIKAKLRGAVSEFSNRSEGALYLRFDAVSFEALGGWLTRAAPVWGYELSAFRIERREKPGIVAAELTLEPQ